MTETDSVEESTLETEYQEETEEEIPREDTKIMRCNFCGEEFDDYLKLGRHIAQKHRKKSRETVSEDKNTTQGLSEIEFVAQYGEEGLNKLRRDKLLKLLQRAPVSKKTVEAIITYYDDNLIDQKDYNQLYNLMHNLGVTDKVARQILDGLSFWEKKIRDSMKPTPTALYPTPAMDIDYTPYVSYQQQYHTTQSTTYTPPSRPSRMQQPMPPQVPYMYPPMQYPYPTPYMPYPQYPPQRTITEEEVQRRIEEALRKSKEETTLSRLEDMFHAMMQTINNLIQQRESKKEEEEYATIEDIAIDPRTGKPLVHNNQPVIIKKRLPVSSIPTLHDLSKTNQTNDLKETLENILEKQKQESNYQIERLEKRLEEITRKYEETKDRLTIQQIEMYKQELDKVYDMMKEQRIHGSEWNSDGAKLLATGIDRLASIIEDRRPLETIATIMTRNQTQQKPEIQPGPSQDIEAELSSHGFIDQR